MRDKRGAGGIMDVYICSANTPPETKFQKKNTFLIYHITSKQVFQPKDNEKKQDYY